MALLAGVAIAIAGFLYGRQVERQHNRELDAVRNLVAIEHERVHARATQRVAFLEHTLDEIRAKQLETTPPLAITPEVIEKGLPEEVEREIEQIEDEEGRQEYREQAQMLIEQFPELEPQAIIDRIFS